MAENHQVASCRFAELTLFQTYPRWLLAEEAPWTCVRLDPPRLIEDTGLCRTCAEWQARSGLASESPRS